MLGFTKVGVVVSGETIGSPFTMLLFKHTTCPSVKGLLHLLTWLNQGESPQMAPRFDTNAYRVPPCSAIITQHHPGGTRSRQVQPVVVLLYHYHPVGIRAKPDPPYGDNVVQVYYAIPLCQFQSFFIGFRHINALIAVIAANQSGSGPILLGYSQLGPAMRAKTHVFTHD